jgi:hypothetical protein
MTVIRKPHDAPLLGGRTVILLGGIDKAAMKRWQQRVRASKKEADPDESSGREAD